MKRYEDINDISKELNDIEIPEAHIVARNIINRASQRQKNVTGSKRDIEFMRVAICFCIMLFVGISVYATVILQTNIEITKEGFFVGNNKSSDIYINSSNITASEGNWVEEVTVVGGGQDVIFKDLTSAFDESGLPNVLPTLLVDTYNLSDEGIRYYTFKGGNLVQKQWEALYKGNGNKEVLIYLDYAKWEGEKDTREGAEFGIGKKVTKNRSYKTPQGIRFEMAKVLEYDGSKSTMAALSVGNYYYMILFRNIKQEEIKEILDSIPVQNIAK